MLPREDTGSVADGVDHPLEPSWVELQRIVGWIVCGVLGPILFVAVIVAMFVASVSGDMKVLLAVAWLAIMGLLVWAAQWWPPIEYRHFSYRLDALGLYIRRGVVWRTVVSVPRARVQHMDVAQGPLERRFGLATLSIYTAGTEFARVDLPGLSYARAVRIRDYLLPGREHGDDNDGT